MNEPIFEGELVIGRLYLVPTAYGPLGSRWDDYPVLGPKHEDKEIIGFKWDHYHYDFRFFNGRQWDYIVKLTTRTNGKSYPHAWVMSERLDINPPVIPGEVIYRRRKYRRAMPEFTTEGLEMKSWRGWLPALEAAYTNATLKPGLICPHRGSSLRGLPVDEEGCVVCPLHGLRWHIESGKLR